MQIFAHRGADHWLFGENTIGAFERARYYGCGAELDVRLTADSQPVVNHDRHVLFGGNKIAIGDHRLNRLVKSKIVADTFSGNYVVPGVPTLKLVLRLFAGIMPLNIELKDEGSAEALLSLMEELGFLPSVVLPKNFIASSFLFKELVAIDDEADSGCGLETALLVDRLRIPFVSKIILARKMAKRHVKGVHLNREIASRETIRFFKDNGFAVRVYTVNDVDEAKKLCVWGVDGIFTDAAGEIMQKLKYFCPSEIGLDA